MDSQSTGIANWRGLLRAWPAELPRRGVLVTAWNEQIPFDGFLLSDAFLLISRQTPDTLGSRMIVLPYDGVAAIKLTEVIRAKALQPLGFTGTLPAR